MESKIRVRDSFKASRPLRSIVTQATHTERIPASAESSLNSEQLLLTGECDAVPVVDPGHCEPNVASIYCQFGSVSSRISCCTKPTTMPPGDLVEEPVANDCR